MLLENSQIIIEVVLILVIVAGIISSRLIVKRLGVIRETYAALNEMVTNLDTSTDHVGRVFDAMKHEANKGGKRLNALVEHARNAGDDLTDMQKMAREVTAALEKDVLKAEAKKDSLAEVIRESQKMLEALESRITFYQDIPSPEALKKHYDEALQEAEKRAKAAFASSFPQAVSGVPTVSFHPDLSDEGLSEASHEGDSRVYSLHFQENLDHHSVPHALRTPRPYMQAVDDKT